MVLGRVQLDAQRQEAAPIVHGFLLHCSFGAFLRRRHFPFIVIFQLIFILHSVLFLKIRKQRQYATEVLFNIEKIMIGSVIM
jgi:hypothetical protein